MNSVDFSRILEYNPKFDSKRKNKARITLVYVTFELFW